MTVDLSPKKSYIVEIVVNGIIVCYVPVKAPSPEAASNTVMRTIMLHPKETQE